MCMTDFLQRNHYEITLLHQRMGNLEIGLVNGQIVVEQYVNVDRAVAVCPG